MINEKDPNVIQIIQKAYLCCKVMENTIAHFRELFADEFTVYDEMVTREPIKINPDNMPF
jgi:hypothetical protein